MQLSPAIESRLRRPPAVRAHAIQAMIRLDWAEVRRSRWLYLFLAINVLLAGGFLSIGMRESALLGFTGMGRVMFSSPMYCCCCCRCWH